VHPYRRVAALVIGGQSGQSVTVSRWGKVACYIAAAVLLATAFRQMTTETERDGAYDCCCGTPDSEVFFTDKPRTDNMECYRPARVRVVGSSAAVAGSILLSLAARRKSKAPPSDIAAEPVTSDP